MADIRLLFIGDIVGRPGREAVANLLPQLRAEYGLNLVIANGENSAGGFGITPRTAEEIFAAGVDVITTGNHVWDQKEAWPALEAHPRVLRPANIPTGAPGRGVHTLEVAGCGPVTILNLMGRLFMHDIDCPFRASAAFFAAGDHAPVVFVDFHAEATSEKQAMGWHLNGRASMVVGTHTHVPTADARILPGGTAFCTDAGMVGPRDSVIGMEPEPVVQRFLSALPQRFKVAEGPVVFNSLLVRINPLSGRASEIERLDRVWEK